MWGRTTYMLWWVIVAVLLLVACNSGPQLPTSAEPTPSHGDIIFDSDFASGWPIENVEAYQFTYASEGYRMSLTSKVPYAHWLASGNLNEQYFNAQITALPETCPPEGGSFGIAFHQQDRAFRVFAITCDNRFIVFEHPEYGIRSAQVVLTEGALPDSITSLIGNEHILVVNAYENQLSVLIDGHRLGTLDIDSFASGDIGPYLQMEQTPISVVFKRLLVYKATEP